MIRFFVAHHVKRLRAAGSVGSDIFSDNVSICFSMSHSNNLLLLALQEPPRHSIGAPHGNGQQRGPRSSATCERIYVSEHAVGVHRVQLF